MLREQDGPETGVSDTASTGARVSTDPHEHPPARPPGPFDAIALVGVLIALGVMIGLQAQGRTSGAPWPVQVTLGALFVGLRADPVQCVLGGGSLQGRNGSRAVVGCLAGSALCASTGVPELVPLFCLIVVCVHLHWRYPSALAGGAVGGAVDSLTGSAFPLVLVASWGLAWGALGNLGVLAQQGEATREHLVRSHRHREAALRHAARHDPLTGLLARGAIVDALARASAAARPGHGAGVLFCDLDGFKQINDQYGHVVGDALLVEVAARLRAATGGAEWVGRTGGDEFVVVLPAVPDDGTVTQIARRVRLAMDAPLAVGDRALRVGISVGTAVTECPIDVDVDDLLNAADARMYAVKHAGHRRPPGAGAFREVPRA